MKKLLLVLLIIGMFSSCTAQGRRTLKTVGSNLTGGLDRTVTVYDMNLNPKFTYKGKIDVESSDGKVLFDLNGERVIWYNVPVSVLEN